MNCAKSKVGSDTVLQIRRGKRDNKGRIFLITRLKTCCDPSLEPSHQDGDSSNEGSHFHWEIWKIIFELSSISCLIRSPETALSMLCHSVNVDKPAHEHMLSTLLACRYWQLKVVYIRYQASVPIFFLVKQMKFIFDNWRLYTLDTKSYIPIFLLLNRWNLYLLIYLKIYDTIK